MKRTAVVWMMLMVMLSGCAGIVSQPPATTTPRENAASQLMLQGLQLLDGGKPDSAIRLFEQAVGLNPNSGECYYYLGQAWLAKGVKAKSRQFNLLARDYLAGSESWMNLIDRQAEQINALSR